MRASRPLGTSRNALAATGCYPPTTGYAPSQVTTFAEACEDRQFEQAAQALQGASYAPLFRSSRAPRVLVRKTHPTLTTRWIAQLGGFLDRKGDGDPGIIVMGCGMQRLYNLVAMWWLFNHSNDMVN